MFILWCRGSIVYRAGQHDGVDIIARTAYVVDCTCLEGLRRVKLDILNIVVPCVIDLHNLGVAARYWQVPGIALELARLVNSQ